MENTMNVSTSLPLHTLRLRWIGRVQTPYRLLRLFRLTWRRGEWPNGYGAKLTLGLRPRLWEHLREFHSHAVTLLGVRVHFSKSFGGYYDA